MRSDKPSSIVIYDDYLGTVPATHYTLSDSLVHYNDNCTDLSYFISTRETAIATSLLKRLDAEVLIGQISYKQRAEIYNEVHYNKGVCAGPEMIRYGYGGK